MSDGQSVQHAGGRADRRRDFLKAGVAASAAAAGVALLEGQDAAATGLTPVTAFNVKEHGATGTGRADDTDAVQRAVDAAAGAGGGTVFFPPGTYAVRTVVLRTAVHLRGSGIDASIVVRSGQSPGAVLESEGFGDLTGGDSAGGITAFSVRDLTIDGNREGGGQAAGMRIYGFGYELTEIVVHDCPGDGIYSEWGSTGSIGGDSHEMEARFAGVRCHTNAGDGLRFLGPHDSMFVNCLAYHNDGAGFHFAGVSHGSQLANLHAWGTEQKIAFELDALAISCANCYGDLDGGIGVLVARNECGWVGGRVIGSRSSSEEEVGFQIGREGGDPVSGTIVDAYVQNCSTAALRLPADGSGNAAGDGGGNVLRLCLFQQADGSAGGEFAFVSGTVHPATQVEVTQGIADPRNRVAIPGFELRAEGDAAPPPPPGSVRVFARASGGRTQLCARFASGRVQVIAEDR